MDLRLLLFAVFLDFGVSAPDSSCEHLVGSPVTFHFGRQLVQGTFQDSSVDLFQIYKDQNAANSLEIDAQNLEDFLISWSSPTRLFRGSNDTFVAVFDAAEKTTSKMEEMLPDPLINRTKTGYERIEKSGDGWKLVDFNEEVDFILVNFEPLSPETWNVTLNHDSIWNDSTKFYEKWDFSFKWNRIDAKFLKFSEDVLYFGEQKMIDVVDMSVGNCMEWQRSLVNDKINPKVVDSVNGAIYNVEKNSEAERTLIGVHDGQKIFRRKCLASKQRKKHKSALTVATHELRFKSAENLYCYEVENCEVAYGPRAMVFDVLIEPKPCPTASSDASAGPVAENVTEVLQNVSSPVALQEDYSSTASAVLNTSISELANNTIAATLNVSTKHLPTEQENIMAAKLSIVGDSLEPNDDAVAKAHTMQLIYILVVIFLAALIIATGVVNGSLFWQLVKTTREEAPSEESSTLRRNSNVEVGRTGAKPSTKKKK